MAKANMVFRPDKDLAERIRRRAAERGTTISAQIVGDIERAELVAGGELFNEVANLNREILELKTLVGNHRESLQKVVDYTAALAKKAGAI